MYTFTIPRESFDEVNPDKQMIRKLIIIHTALASKMHNNMRYYMGKHKILDEEGRENKGVGMK